MEEVVGEEEVVEEEVVEVEVVEVVVAKKEMEGGEWGLDEIGRGEGEK